MAVGNGRLRTALKNEQIIKNIDKSRSKPVKAKEEKAEKKIVKPVVVAPVAEVKVVKTKAVSEDDYKSDTLSKKEQRKLNKLLKRDEEIVAEIEEDEEEEEEEVEEDIDLEKLAASDSEDDIFEDAEEGDEDDEDDEEENEDEEDEEEEDVPLSDVEIDSDADIVPHTKLTINNLAALKDSLARIALPWAKHSFLEHQSVTATARTDANIRDIYDDTDRELAFYKQSLDAVTEARTKILKLKVPFSRPMDYFAEMIKSDEHMDKLKSKLLQEAADKKASEEAKKQRHLKKFGKQVQNATLQERAKSKKETLDKIKTLKRKRQSNDIGNDEFDVALEEATADVEERKDRRGGSNFKRQAKDKKFGFGGKKRFSRENDSKSSSDVSGFSSRKMKGQSAKRPGKSRRRGN